MNNLLYAVCTTAPKKGVTGGLKELGEKIVNQWSVMSDFQKYLSDPVYNGSSAIVEKYNEIKSMKGLKDMIAHSYCDGGININKITGFLIIDQVDWNMAKGMYTYFLPLGIFMLVLYFLLDLSNQSINKVRDMDIKAMLFCFFKCGVGLVLLTYFPVIMGGLVNASNAMINAAVDGTLLGGATITENAGRKQLYDTILNYLTKAKFMDLLGLMLSAVILQLAQLVPELIILLQAISRKIMIIIRLGIAPFASVDIYNGFSNSKCLVYLKKLFVDLMYGMLMIAIIKICFNLETTHMVNMLASLDTSGGNATLPSTSMILETCLFGFASAGLVSSGKQLLNEALGV